MTETGSGVVYDGLPLDEVEISLRSVDGVFHSTVDTDTAEGEILLRAPMLFRCYRDGGDGRVEGPDGAKDWFATGDAGRLTADGMLVVSGRLDDVITTGAEKVWPDLVERVLSAHPDVARGGRLEALRPRMGRTGRRLGGAERRRPVARRAAGAGRRDHRSLGGAQGARDRRRPASHSSRARSVGGSSSRSALSRSRPVAPARSCALSRCSLSGFDITRTPTIAPSMMSSTRAAATTPSFTNTVAGWPLRTVARGTPWTFFATLTKKRELRWGPTTGRMAALTFPPPSVQTTTSSDSMASRPDRSPVAQATRKRSVSSRPWRRSASKR